MVCACSIQPPFFILHEVASLPCPKGFGAAAAAAQKFRSCLCFPGPSCIWHLQSCSQASCRLARVFAYCWALHCPVVIQARHACRQSIQHASAVYVTPCRKSVVGDQVHLVNLTCWPRPKSALGRYCWADDLSSGAGTTAVVDSFRMCCRARCMFKSVWWYRPVLRGRGALHDQPTVFTHA